MIICDLNLYIYAMDEQSPHHEAARAWFEGVVETREKIALPWIVVVGYLRIVTHPRLGRVAIADAVQTLDRVLQHPNVIELRPGLKHWAILSKLVISSQSKGDLVSDAHIAALALESGATVCTNDRDFSRFPGLKVRYPLQEG